VEGIALHRAYFDKSQTEHQAGITSIGGYVATKDVWERLEPLWIKNVADWGLDRFHLTELLNPMGPLGRESGELCIRNFSQLLRIHALRNLYSAVVQEDWDAVKKPLAFATHFPTIYHFCFEHILVQLSWFGRDFAPGEPIAPFFDEDVSPESVKHISDAYIKSSLYPNLAQSITWGNSYGHVLLQAADLVAGEMRRYWFDRKFPIQGTVVAPERRFELNLAASGKNFRDSGLWQKGNIEVAVLDFESHGDAFFLPHLSRASIYGREPAPPP
jgi:hypothetical protein